MRVQRAAGGVVPRGEMKQVSLATARGRPAALFLRASAPKLSAGQLTVGTDRVNRHFSAMANVVTNEELRELKQLKGDVACRRHGCRGPSNYDAGDELRGITQLSRNVCQNPLKGGPGPIQETGVQVGFSNPIQAF